MIEKTAFNVQLNTTHFGEYFANELSVKIVDNYVEIHGKQGWRPYPGGFLRREFTQRHIIPNDVDPENLVCSINNDGILFIQASSRLLTTLMSKVEEEQKKKKVTMAPGTKYERDVPISIIE